MSAAVKNISTMRQTLDAPGRAELYWNERATGDEKLALLRVAGLDGCYYVKRWQSIPQYGRDKIVKSVREFLRMAQAWKGGFV